jgi:hypothetical protein
VELSVEEECLEHHENILQKYRVALFADVAVFDFKIQILNSDFTVNNDTRGINE